MISLKATLEAITKALSVDYIVEQGTSGIWTYRKWNSGISECWGTQTMTMALTGGWGGLVDGYGVKGGLQYPDGLFVENPAFFLGTNSSGGGFSFEQWGDGSATKTPNITGVRPNVSTFTATICLRAIGRWK